jgi:AAA family ATP:ADP antiporter
MVDESSAVSLRVSDNTKLVAAATIGLAASFLLCGYEFLRSPANALFTEVYHKEGLPYIRAIVPVGVLIMLYGYGWLLTRCGPRRTLLITSLLSGLGILGCYGAIQFHVNWARGLLFIIQESYIVLLIEQYWSFLNSRLGADTAKKLNGPICGVASIGAILADLALARYSKQLGSVTMLAFGAAAILPAALCSDLAYRWCGEPPRSNEDEPVKKDYLGLKLFASHRLLILLLLIIIATQVISTTLDLNLQGHLVDAVPNTDERSAKSGEIYATVNAVAAIGQFALSPILLRLVPIGVIHIILPLINAVSCIALLTSPSLSSATTAFICFKSVDYSLFKSAKEILYIPFSFDVRYRAKELIDVWGYRFSKGGTSATIAFFKMGGAVISDATYAVIATAAAFVWLALIIPASRLFRGDGES